MSIPSRALGISRSPICISLYVRRSGHFSSSSVHFVVVVSLQSKSGEVLENEVVVFAAVQYPIVVVGVVVVIQLDEIRVNGRSCRSLRRSRTEKGGGREKVR